MAESTDVFLLGMAACAGLYVLTQMSQQVVTNNVITSPEQVLRPPPYRSTLTHLDGTGQDHNARALRNIASAPVTERGQTPEHYLKLAVKPGASPI